MSLLNLFQQHIREKHFFGDGDLLIVACSGGIDSVVLCDLLASSSIPFSIAHMNFRLRDAESDRDEAFVVELANTYQSGLFVKKTDAARFATEQGMSIQVAARELRYNWFNELLDESQSRCKFVLTAHHRDDAIETSLLHFLRGTGIRGLTGIPERNDRILRPLLPFSRSQIREYADEKQLRWVEDSSNISDKYSRNYIRHQLIPAAEKLFPAVKENLAGNLQRFSEVNEIYQQSIEKLRRKLVLQDGNTFKIPVARLINSKPLQTILYECFSPFGFHASQLPELLALCSSGSGRWIESNTHRVIRHRNWLLVHPRHEAVETGLTLIEEDSRTIETPMGTLHITVQEKQPLHIHKSPAFAIFDESKLKYPLILRKWAAGDYFYPFGMDKKKKVARFLIDQKLSKLQKENILVLEMNKKILWIVGLRIDNRFRVSGSTQKALQIEWKPFSK